MSATMYAQRAVNVRDLPDTSGNKIGGLSTNQEVSVTGQCNETGWYRISYNGSEAFVSDKYLGDSKVEVKQTAQSNTATQSETASSTDTNVATNDDVCPVDLNAMWYDAANECVYWYWYDENGNGLMDDSENKSSASHKMLEENTGIKWFHASSTVDGWTWQGKQIGMIQDKFQEEGKPAPGEVSGVEGWW